MPSLRWSEQTYATPLYCPVWPNSAFLHRTGITSGAPLTPAGTVVTTGVVTTGAIVVTDVTAGLVAAVTGAMVPSVEPEPDVDDGAYPHGATVVDTQEVVSKFLIRPNSL